MRYIIVLITVFVGFTGYAAADPATGTWLTQADKKGQVAYVNVTKCGLALCGKIIKAFDPNGKQITTPNVGKRVFWDMISVGGGKYEGRAFVPAHNKEYPGKMALNGNQLKVGGCVGPICMSQKWKRVQ